MSKMHSQVQTVRSFTLYSAKSCWSRDSKTKRFKIWRELDLKLF